MTTDPSEVVDMQHSESSSARSRQKDPPVLERSSSNCCIFQDWISISEGAKLPSKQKSLTR